MLKKLVFAVRLVWLYFYKHTNVTVFGFIFYPFQVLLSTLAFTAFELPPNEALGTKILEFLFHSRSDLVCSLLLSKFYSGFTV